MDQTTRAEVDIGALRRSVSGLVMQLRRSAAEERPAAPRFVAYDVLRLPGGQVVGRKKVILMSGGCSVPTCTMCPFTNENNFGQPTSPRDLLTQVRSVLTREVTEPSYEVVSLYNDGSFFAPREVPPDVRLEIAGLVARSGVSRLIVESLPQFITERALAPFVAALGRVRLEVGIGLQSADDLVREVLVNTRITRISFERALRVMAGLDVDPKVYLMVKPPFLTDGEAVTDVAGSAAYLGSLGVLGATLCPTRVSPNTVAWKLWRAGLYAPPNLWTVVEAARRVHEQLAARVACVNLRGTDFESVFPEGCPRCADRVVDSLVRFGETGDLADLPEPCACRPRLEEVSALDHAAITARAAEAVRAVSGDGVGGWRA